MILKIHRISSCKYISKCEYKIEKDNTENVNITNKIKPNDEPYDVDEEESNENGEDILKELQSKLEYLGESPSSSDREDLYNYLYENLIKSKKSKYEDEILNLQKQSYESAISHTIGEPDCDGKYNRDQYILSWYFEVKECKKVYLIHNFNNDKGCGCFSSSFPLAVFSDEEMALNFMKKCNDFNKKDSQDYSETCFYLDVCEI